MEISLPRILRGFFYFLFDRDRVKSFQAFLSSSPFFDDANATPLEARRSAIFQPAIGSPDDFERPRVAGVIKFRIFFKFLRFHSHDLAPRRIREETEREKEATNGRGKTEDRLEPLSKSTDSTVSLFL